MQEDPYVYKLNNYTIFSSFLDDIEVMLKWRPPVVYKYLWKYVCLLSMVGLLVASLLRMFFKWPTYTAWNENTVRRQLTRLPVLKKYLFTSLYLLTNVLISSHFG